MIDVLMEEQLIFEISNRFQFQLKRFHLEILQTSEQNDIRRSVIQFPQLDQLKSFTVFIDGCEICPPRTDVWQNLMPNVTRLKFAGLNESLFLDWIRDSVFQNVEKVDILLDRGDDNYNSSPTVPILKEMHLSFLNIQKLTLTFNFRELEGLRYIFHNIT